MSEKDIVKRLTHAAYAPTKASNSDVINGKINSQLLTDAAAEITRLRSRVLEYESALCEIADCPGAVGADDVAKRMRLTATRTLGINDAPPPKET